MRHSGLKGCADGIGEVQILRTVDFQAPKLRHLHKADSSEESMSVLTETLDAHTVRCTVLDKLTIDEVLPTLPNGAVMVDTSQGSIRPGSPKE